MEFQPGSLKMSYSWQVFLLPVLRPHGCALSHFSRLQLFATQWTVACQAPLSTGFSWQEYPSGLPCPPPGDLFDPGIGPVSPALQVDSLPPSHWGSPSEVQKWASPFLTSLLVGVIASALTRGSVKTWDRSLLDCTSGGGSPALPLAQGHAMGGDPLSSGYLSRAICRDFCRSPAALILTRDPNSQQKPAVALFLCFGQSLSKFAITIHWLIDLFTPQKGLAAALSP